MESTLVIHLSFQKFISEEKKDFYFGSIASVYDFFTSAEVGVSKGTLYANFKSSDDAVYISPNCIITKARLIRKKRL